MNRIEIKKENWMVKTKSLWPTLKRLINYAKPWRNMLLLASVMLFIASISEVSGPILVSYLINNFVEKKNITFVLMSHIVVSFIVLQSLAAVLHYYQGILFNHAAINIVEKIRIDVMNVALRQPMNIFDTQPVGKIVSNITNDTEVIKDLYVTVTSTILRSITLIIAMVIAMFLLEWRIALVVMLFFPMVAIVMLIYQHYSIPIARRVRTYLGEINNTLNEVINGMTVIQQFRQQNRFGKRMDKINYFHYLAKMEILRLDGCLLRPLFGLLSSLILCLILIVFKFFIYNNAFKIGMLYAFIVYLGRLNEPLIELTTQQSMLQQAIVSGERVFELIDTSQQQYGFDNRPLSSGKIIFRNLSFSYDQNHLILKNINLNIPSCSFIALVGHTGSGKSTVANLLMGYYPVICGEILLDDRKLHELTYSVIRRGIAMVQQDPVILADTLLANIRLGRNISEKIIWKVLKFIKMDILVHNMPNGIHTLLNEQGNNLSIGQKQLITLARVLVDVPQVLILDEATSNIDSETEQAIQNTLDVLRNKSTLIVIAHRLSTITKADNILVLNFGKIVEHGNHKQLIEQKGRYWKMYQLQREEKKLTSNAIT